MFLIPTLDKRIDAEGDKPLTYCEVDISKDLFFGEKPKGYIRIELEDEKGKDAGSIHVYARPWKGEILSSF